MEPEMDSPFVVELEAVDKAFGGTWALRGLDLRLEKGVSYGLIGRNGAWKTTALRRIAGLLRPHRGRVRVFGGDPTEEAERVKVKMGYLAEDQSYPGILRPSELFGFFQGCYPTWDLELLRS